MQKILVIDDDALIREAVTATLEGAGYEVREASNGREGIALAREYLPDLIISDIMMPQVDGYGVLLELRSHSATWLIPFIFLTARVERQYMRRGMELGADDFITKPFTRQELLTAVERRLERHSALQTAAPAHLFDVQAYLNLTLPHELRTPLSVIIGYVDILAKEHQIMDPQTTERMLDTISDATLSLYRLTENFLAHAQLEVIERDPHRIETLRSYGVCDQANTVLSLTVQSLAAAHNRSPDLVLGAMPEARLRVFKLNFRKIIEEIVDNAFKFSPPGSPVTVSAALDDSRYRIQIADRGRGLSAEQIATIAPFVQFDRQRFEQKGVGLGLSIAKRLTELYGGEFRMVSTPGQQTEVTIWLPLVSAAASA